MENRYTSHVTVRVTRPKDKAEHTPCAMRDPRRARAFVGSLPHQAGVTCDKWGSRYRLCHMPLTFFITFNAQNNFMSQVLSPTFARRGSSDPSQLCVRSPPLRIRGPGAPRHPRPLLLGLRPSPLPQPLQGRATAEPTGWGAASSDTPRPWRCAIQEVYRQFREKLLCSISSALR